jgi:hypothetical protein
MLMGTKLRLKQHHFQLFLHKNPSHHIHRGAHQKCKSDNDGSDINIRHIQLILHVIPFPPSLIGALGYFIPTQAF